MSNELPESTCVPQITEQSEDCFVSKELVTPWSDEIHGCEVITSALKFNRSIDVMGLSTITNLLKTGAQDMTDSIDKRALITSIYVNVFNNGIWTPQRLFLNTSVQFVKTIEGTDADLALDKLVCFSDVGGHKVEFKIYGTLNVQTCTLELRCDSSVETIIPLGYTPRLNRINLNLR